jgi:hypothetical protein
MVLGFYQQIDKLRSNNYGLCANKQKPDKYVYEKAIRECDRK